MQRISSAFTLCKYCGQQSTETSDFCCHACEMLYLVDYQSWLPGTGDLTSVKLKKWQYMDSAEFLNHYRSMENPSQFTIYVEGLQCASCIHLLEKIPEFYDQVQKAEVNFTLSLLVVHTLEAFKLSQLMTLIDDLGYRAQPILKSENLTSKFVAENRIALKRIAVAGACAGNIMLFVVPIYAGLSGDYARLFNWISFFLFLPILGYSAIPFYKAAWSSLRYRVINVDLPIVIALVTGFVFSTWNLVHGKSEVYYDSTASFIFLILSTRYLVKRIQQSSLGESSISNFLPLQNVEVKKENGFESQLSSRLCVGDMISILPDQVVPADGTLYSVSADLDVSLLSGESLPQTYAQGMDVLAGTRGLNKPFLMSIEKLGLETEIGKIVSSLEKESLGKTRFVTLSEKISQWLIFSVFTLAVLFFVIYGGLVSYDDAFNRALALIVIACPCALAFGTPLTYALSLRKARDVGILIKNGNVFEKMANVKTIFFDKTGTLTSGQLKLSQTFPLEIEPEWKQIILALESGSLHPLAFAFRATFANVTPAVLTEKTEHLGLGVNGTFCGDVYSIESSGYRQESGLMSVSFKKNSETLAYFYFSDELHSDTKNVIQNLKKSGFQLGMISGDKKFVVEAVAREIMIPDPLVFAEKKPFEKLEIIKRFENVCMIGDGANDALALKQAELGISVKGAVSVSHNSSEVYFTRPGLKSLLDLIKISVRSQNILKTNLAFALLYNFLGGSLALMGFINPLVAAVLMPISSVLITINSYRGLK